MAAAAMLFPLGVGLLRDASLSPGRSNVGRAIMISTAFGPLIGGIATPAGTAANLVAIAQLKQLADVDISFTRWMLYGVPASILMVPLAWRLLLWRDRACAVHPRRHPSEARGVGTLRPVERNGTASSSVTFCVIPPTQRCWNSTASPPRPRTTRGSCQPVIATGWSPPFSMQRNAGTKSDRVRFGPDHPLFV